MAVSQLPGVAGVKIELIEHGANAHVERSTIASGANIPDHAHKVASSYVVLSGKGRVTGARGRDVAAGDVVSVEAGQHHGWESHGDGPLTIVGTFASAYPETQGVTFEVVEHGAGFRVERSTVSAGASIPEHSHDVASSFVVVSGKGRHTGSHGRDVSAGDVVFLEAGQPHGWENHGDGPLTIVGTFTSAVGAANGVKFEVLERGTDMHVERSTVHAGASIVEHAHKVSSTYVVVSGTGRLTGPRGRGIAAGDVVLVEAGQQHGWESAGAEPLSIVGTFASG